MRRQQTSCWRFSASLGERECPVFLADSDRYAPQIQSAGRAAARAFLQYVGPSWYAFQHVLQKPTLQPELHESLSDIWSLVAFGVGGGGFGSAQKLSVGFQKPEANAVQVLFFACVGCVA